jgi:hypothetical protein
VSSVHQIDVERAVTVEIEEAAPRAHGLDHVFLFGRGVVVYEVDSLGRRSVLESDVPARDRESEEQ